MAKLFIIRDLCKKKGISLTWLSSKLGISNSALQKIIKTNSTKIDTLERIAKILKVPISIFFEKFEYTEYANFEKLQNEIKENAFKGKGLIYLEYNPITEEFETNFRELKESVPKETLNNLYFEKIFDKLLKEQNKDEKGFVQDNDHEENE